MKKILLFVFLCFTIPIFSGGLHFGIIDAIKEKKGELKEKIREGEKAKIPSPPLLSLVGEYELGTDLGMMYEIEATERYLYLVEHNLHSPYSSKVTLRIIDISNPSSCKELGSCSVNTMGTSVPLRILHVSGNYAYILPREYLEIINISNPNRPNPIVGITFQYPLDFTVSKNYAYICCSKPDGIYPLKIIDVDLSKPGNPKEIGSVSYPSLLINKSKDGNKLYIIGNGLQIMDISTSSFPSLLGTCSVSPVFPPWNLEISNNICCFGSSGWNTSDYYLNIIDISNSSNPILLSTYIEKEAYQMTISKTNKQIYLVTNDGLKIIDISNPYFPKEIERYPNYRGYIYTFDKYFYMITKVSNPKLLIFEERRR